MTKNVVVERVYDGREQGCLIVNDTRVAGCEPVLLEQGNVLQVWRLDFDVLLDAMGVVRCINCKHITNRDLGWCEAKEIFVGRQSFCESGELRL